MHKIKQQRRKLILGMVFALPIAIILWLTLFYFIPPISGMEDPIARLFLAISCICLAVLFCFFMGIEAVSHERLFSEAINPLLGKESKRLQINLRYLQHTLEQLILFIPGLLALAYICDTPTTIKAVVATTVVWIVARFAFWIGYHISPDYRAPGLISMITSLVMLIYVTTIFIYDITGIIGVVILLFLFVAIEAYLVFVTHKPAKA